MNLIGAAVKRLTGVPWVADQRDSLVAERRPPLRAQVRPGEGEGARARGARSSRNRADGIVAVSDAIADEMRALDPRGPGARDPERLRLRRLRRARVPPGDRFRITHTGSFFGKRNPRPFLSALASSGLDDVVARFVGDFRSADREWAEELDLGDRLELLTYAAAPRARSSCSATRRRSCCSCPTPPAAGKVVPSGKIFEYLAAERPILAAVPTDGAAAELVRETGAGRRRRARRRGRRCARRSSACTRAGRPAGSANGYLSDERAQAALAHDARRGARRAALEPRVTRSRDEQRSSRSSSSRRSFCVHVRRRCSGTSRARSSSPT